MSVPEAQSLAAAGPGPPKDLRPLPLPLGIQSGYIQTADLTYHFLVSGIKTDQSKGLILLVHGFPELAFSWRHVMSALAREGYQVVAFDQRGYGRTTGWDTRPYDEVDISTFAFTRIVQDVVGLVFALGYRTVRCLIGHDFGAVGVSCCALVRPDVFESVIMMSAPASPPPSLPFNVVHKPLPKRAPPSPVKAELDRLAKLPEPRKHYKWYFSTPPAATDMIPPDLQPTEQRNFLTAFLRNYFYLKSGAWDGNKPHPLAGWKAEELAKMPNYYIMPLSATMPQAVGVDPQSPPTTDEQQPIEKSISTWMPPKDLAVYVQEYSRTGFQGGLNYYRVSTDGKLMRETMGLFSGRKIEIPALFVAGERDWGAYQGPGALEEMEALCVDWRGVRWVKGAGHWVQQEGAREVAEIVVGFLGELEKEKGRQV